MSRPPVFNLPPRRSAKAAPELIQSDREHFDAVAASLRRTIAELTGRLAAERRAPAGAYAQALERDQEVHRLTARLRTLRRFELDLCLGRIVPADGSTPVYIGRLGLAGEDGRPLLVDWRTPAAAPFFAATLAEPLGLRSRRRYRWTDGRITDYWDEMFQFDGEHPAAPDEESAFIASLAASRTPRMRDVLGTIAADQDAILRAGSAGTLVVDGGPGTGKTVVALHRAAYLLYSDPLVDRRRGGVLFIGPHQPYLDYVADVLPSLGEDGVRTCTIRDLVAEGAECGSEPDAAVARLKGSLDVVCTVDTAVRFYEQPPDTSMTVSTDWDEVPLSPADWQRAFEVPDPGTPHNEARRLVWDELLQILIDAHDPEVPADEVRSALEQNRDLLQQFNRNWPLIDATDLVADLWSVPAYLRLCAPALNSDEREQLQRNDPRAWTTADLPWLDLARRRLGDPAAARERQRRDAVIAADRRRFAAVVDDLIAHDDSEMLVMSMLRGDDLRNALDDADLVRDPQTTPTAGPFAHLIVDEAQELTDAEWQMLVQRCPSGSVTVVGDRAQARHGFGESWPDRLQRAGLEHVRVATLSLNYRTPAEIMAVAEPVIRAVLPDANVPTSIRHSGRPVTRVFFGEHVAVVADWLAAHDEGTACVIGDPAFAAGGRVRSLPPPLVKGLEFDLVVLAESGSPHHEQAVQTAVDRYVAMTRATQQLVLVERTPAQP